MSRSAADATRFTATGPYASSKTGAFSVPGAGKPKGKKNAPPQLGPDGQPETPKEKVERLRAQARAAKKAQAAGSGADRWIESGRRFANKAHKGMVYSLIAASGMFDSMFWLGHGTIYDRPIRVHVDASPLIRFGVVLMLIRVFSRCLWSPYDLLDGFTYNVQPAPAHALD